MISENIGKMTGLKDVPMPFEKVTNDITMKYIVFWIISVMVSPILFPVRLLVFLFSCVCIDLTARISLVNFKSNKANKLVKSMSISAQGVLARILTLALGYFSFR